MFLELIQKAILLISPLNPEILLHPKVVSSRRVVIPYGKWYRNKRFCVLKCSSDLVPKIDLSGNWHEVWQPQQTNKATEGLMDFSLIFKMIEGCDHSLPDSCGVVSIEIPQETVILRITPKGLPEISHFVLKFSSNLVLWSPW